MNASMQMAAAAAVVSADCELLGRGSVQGSADSDSLAALVRQLCKQQQRDRLPARWCTVTCSRDAGLEIVPYQPQHQRQHEQQHQHEQQQQRQHEQQQQQQQQQNRKRPDDEGFESDEDLASLGSYEGPVKRKSAGPLAAAASVATGAVSDSANSSGVSEDSDDADAASLGEQQPVAVDADGAGLCGREAYGLTDVAFCHTDADALPGIAVWVIKTRRTGSGGSGAVTGLEAVVVRAGRDGRLHDVCSAYREHSRRLKLEPKPSWAGSQATAGSSTSSSSHPAGSSSSVQRRKIVTLTAPEINCRYNLVQRTDTDGVTHIEVTAGPVTTTVTSSATAAARGDASSIISMSTPELTSRPANRDAGGGGEGCPPQRPERRRYKAKTEVTTGGGGDSDSGRRQQKVVRGQFIRVNVNHGAVPLPAVAASEPETTSTSAAALQESPAAGKSTDRLWSTADYDRPSDSRYEQQQHSRRSSSRPTGNRTRSRSTGPGRRQYQLQPQPPSPTVQLCRYPPAAAEQQSSFGTRFFGKLRDITASTNQLSQQDLQPTVFRRRNSVGESATANFYQYFNHHHHHNTNGQYTQQQQHNYYVVQQQQSRQQQQQQQAKSGGNLKSVIKKNNKSQLYQHAYDEPKKVTFSAYATVQVVD